MGNVLRRGFGILAVVALVASCGGGSGDGNAAEPDATSCTVPADAALGAEGDVCADTGLRPSADGFSFENWGGPVAGDAVTVTTAIAIFGREAVCAKDTADGCVPFPAVKHWIDSTNLQIQGGRCEGMAVLSQRLHDGEEVHATLQADAQQTIDLSKPVVPVAASISRWWVSQGFERVLEATNKAAQMKPSEIAAQLVDAIGKKAGATIGIYANGSGHAITPIAVTRTADGNFDVLNYDNNFPGKVTTLKIDAAAETWTYDVGATNSGAASSVWSGGKGSMDFALMADREGEQKVPWSTDDRGATSKGSARITVSTGGASVAGLIITVGKDVIDSRDLTTVSNGVKVYPNRGGVGTGAMVEIPAGLSGVTVKPVVGEILDDNATTVNLVLAVDAPGPGSQIVRDELSGDDLEDGAYDDFTLSVSTDGDYESEFDVADDGAIDLGVAYEEESLGVTLEDGQDLELTDPEGEGDFAVNVTDAEGESLYKTSFDGTADDGELSTTSIDIDEATGKAVVEEQPIEPESVDTELLSVVDDGSPTEATTSSNADDEPEQTATTLTTTDDGNTGDSGKTPDTEAPANSADATDDTEAPQTTKATKAPPVTDAPSDTAADTGGDSGSGDD